MDCDNPTDHEYGQQGHSCTPMRPFHEVLRLLGFETPEPVPATATETMLLTKLMELRLAVAGATMADAIRVGEVYCREANIKPAILLALVRDLEVRIFGQQLASRTLIFSGRVGSDGSIIFRARGNR